MKTLPETVPNYLDDDYLPEVPARNVELLGDATILHKQENEYGQMIEFHEHPIYGCESSILAVYDGVAVYTGFYDLQDMCSEYTNKEYEIVFLQNHKAIHNFQLIN